MLKKKLLKRIRFNIELAQHTLWILLVLLDCYLVTDEKLVCTLICRYNTQSSNDCKRQLDFRLRIQYLNQ